VIVLAEAPPSWIASVAVWVIGAIFGAGGALVSLRQTRFDLKGISQKINRLERLENERYSAICLAILAAVPDEKRAVVAGLLKIGATL
jgi:hypothetical protein